MAYNIYRSDGTPVTVPDNAIDTAYYNASGGSTSNGLGVQLIGRNAIDYGAGIAQNFVQMLENFASNSVPSDSTSLQGQMWFKTTSTSTGNLYVRITTNGSGGIANWQQVVTTSTTHGGSVPSVNPTTPADGDIKVVGSVISMYAGGVWNQVFPAVYSA